jgi:hypothetical protein
MHPPGRQWGPPLANERQIAANRRNARKSSGPRSRAGKRRASHNAYRHGLTSNITPNAFAKEVEDLARKIAGDAGTLEPARAFAHAQLDLARVRRAKIAVIERSCAFGYLDPPQDYSARQLIRLIKAFERDGVIPPAPDPSESMPPQEPYRSAEAIRRVLPELLKLDRYERGACARRDRALRELIGKRVQPKAPFTI